jgi:hypothetical protein
VCSWWQVCNNQSAIFRLETSALENTAMTLISAAENQQIDLQGGGWKLRRGDDIWAWAELEGLRYERSFAMARRLPTDGLLRNDHIQQVVLGWQPSDESWHLGLLFSAEITEKRGSRWCELARWPDPDQTLFKDLAQEAGERLGIILDVYFNYIEPESLTPKEPQRDLPSLPLALGNWQLVGEGVHEGVTVQRGQVAFVRTRAWRTASLRRAAMNFVWAILYTAVSLLTLTSAINLPNAGTLIPNPHLLPYFGLLIAVGMVFYGIYQLVRFNTAVRVITADSAALTGHSPSGVAWTVFNADVRSVYISEILKSNKGTATTHGELNVHLGGGKFHHILEQEVPLIHDGDTGKETRDIMKSDTVEPLTRNTYFTDMQAAALYVGEAMKQPVWTDVRMPQRWAWLF